MRSFINSGILESKGSQTIFGALISNGEEILINGSAYGCKENDPVIFDIEYSHKFKRAVNVMNLNQVLEHLSYLLFYSKEKSEKHQEEVLDLKMKADFLLGQEYKKESLSHSAKRAFDYLKNSH